MTGWIIAGILLFLLVFLMASPLRIAVDYAEGAFSCVVSYLFFKLDLTGPLKKKEKLPKEPEKPKKEKEGKQKEPEDKLQPQEILKLILNSLSNLYDCVRSIFLSLRKHLIFDVFRLSTDFSTGDAANTALCFGAMNALVYNFFAVFYYNFIIKEKNIVITPCFTDEPFFKAEFQTRIHIRVFWIFGLVLPIIKNAVGVLINFMRVKADKKQGKKSKAV